MKCWKTIVTPVLGGNAAFVDHVTPLHEEDDAIGQTEMEGGKIMFSSSLLPFKPYEEDLNKWTHMIQNSSDPKMGKKKTILKVYKLD